MNMLALGTESKINILRCHICSHISVLSMIHQPRGAALTGRDSTSRKRWYPRMLSSPQGPGIPESLRLEKTYKITESNLCPISTLSTQPEN